VGPTQIFSGSSEGDSRDRAIRAGWRRGSHRRTHRWAACRPRLEPSRDRSRHADRRGGGGWAYGALKRGPTPLLQKQIERLNHLPKAQQKVVLKMLDGVLSQHR
jgi:hypothetical protein